MEPSIRRLEPPFQLPPPMTTTRGPPPPLSPSSSSSQHPRHASSPLGSSFPSLQQQPPCQPSNSLTPMDLPLPSPSFREGHGHHNSTSTSASSFNSSALDSPRIGGGGNHRAGSGIDTPPSSTMGSPPTDFPAPGGGRGWGGNGAAVMGSRKEESEEEEEAGQERDLVVVREQQHQHPHHQHNQSYDSNHHRYAGSSRSERSDSVYNPDDRAFMTTPDFISSFDTSSSSKPWTSVFGGPVASTSTSSAPPSFSPSPTTQSNQPEASPSSTASSSRTRDTGSSTSSLPPTRFPPPPPRPTPAAFPSQPSSLVPLTMVHEQGTVYVETTSAEAARAYKKQLDRKEGVEGGNSSKRSPFVIESGSKGGRPIFSIRRRSNSAIDPVLLRALSPIHPPSSTSSFSPPTSPRSPTGPVAFLPLARPSSPNNSRSTAAGRARSPTTTAAVKPKGRLLRLSQSMQSMGAAYGSGRHKVVEPVVPGSGKLAFPEGKVVRQFFGSADRPLSSVPHTLNNPLISITTSSPSPRRRQSALTLQTFPSSSLGGGAPFPTSPTRTRTSSRPVRPEPPMSPTQRIRLLSQQLFKPGERPSMDENANAPLKPKSSSGSLRGLFLRKMGSVPALRGMQSFESGGSGETARPEGSERDSSRTTTRRPRRDSAHGRLSSEELDRDVTPRPEKETVVLLGPVPVPAKERSSSGEDASKLLTFPTSATPAVSPPMEDQTFTTQIFDVFQEYRGDPNADLESVAPGDDPRFVVWKVSILPQSQPISKRASAAPSSTSSSSNPSPIALSPGHPLPNPSSSSSLVKTTRTLEAATIERWVAQITFNFNLEVWLDFFLVYRAYISPLSLCRLLMARFEWGCRTQAGDGVDLRGAKQLAASRACYVLRVWLTGFFEVDWLNEKEMRSEFTTWLNVLSSEKRGFDKLSRNTLSKLRKVIKDLKDRYNSPAFDPSLHGFGSSPSTPLPDDAFSAASFATAQAANQLLMQRTPPLQQQQHQHATIRNGSSSNRSGSSSSNSFSPQNIASLMSLPSSFGRSKIPKFFRSIGKGTFGSNRPMLGGNSFELGVNDEGDVLSRKGGVDILLSSLKVSSPPASDFESSAASMSEDSHGDTTGSSSDTSGRFVVAGLGIGGVEVVDPEEEAHRPSYQSASLDSVVEERPSHEMERPPAVVPEVRTPPISPAKEQTIELPSDDLTTPPHHPRPSNVEDDSADQASPPTLGSPAPIRQPLFGFTRDASPAASSDIQNAIIPFHTLDIDDADFSSSDDDSFHQPIRRLPAGGPQLQLVRRSIDTLSSYVQAPQRGSTHSTSSAGSNRGSGPQPFNYELLKEFRVDELESDEDDDGGAEGALLRLEGKFDPEKQKAKNAKVEFLVQQAISKSRQRSGSNDASMDPTGARRGGGSDEDGTGFGGRESLIEFDAPAPPPPPPNPTPATQTSSPESETSSQPTKRVGSVRNEPDMDLLIDTLNATPSSRPQTVEPPLTSNDTIPNLLSTPRPAEETKLPPSSYTSPTAPSRKTPVTPSKRNSLKKRRPSNPAPSSIPKVLPPAKHVCFIFKFKTDLLAIHFAHIDAQLMNGISFVELGSLPPPWLTNAAPQLDSWEALLSERTSRKVHGRPKISDASMWVRRFEMMSRWVESEIILTPRVQRPALISRFVKLAYKTSELSDFLSTVAIINGLRTPFVKLSLGEKAWSKVSLLQELNHLRNLTSPDGGYANLRRAHSEVADQHVELFEGDAWAVPAHGGAAAGASTSARSSVGSDGPAGQFYIPFMGIYLQDLETIDRASNFPIPQLPSDLAPLPEGIVPGPLINVAKAKQRAKILREVIVFNTLASKYPTDIDGGVYRLCLKLSALPISSVERLANDLRSL